MRDRSKQPEQSSLTSRFAGEQPQTQLFISAPPGSAEGAARSELLFLLSSFTDVSDVMQVFISSGSESAQRHHVCFQFITQSVRESRVCLQPGV